LWYEQGKKMNKKNSFLDFISCGDFLCNQYSSPNLMAAYGASAGGLLLGNFKHHYHPKFFQVPLST
jgi:oligopeptidase B